MTTRKRTDQSSRLPGHWLFKSEPSGFSWGDLLACPNQTAEWDGIRNFQAGNYLREIKVEDEVLFYHSSIPQPVIVGTAIVVRESYPDFRA